MRYSIEQASTRSLSTNSFATHSIASPSEHMFLNLAMFFNNHSIAIETSWTWHPATWKAHTHTHTRRGALGSGWWARPLSLLACPAISSPIASCYMKKLGVGLLPRSIMGCPSLCTFRQTQSWVSALRAGNEMLQVSTKVATHAGPELPLGDAHVVAAACLPCSPPGGAPNPAPAAVPCLVRPFPFSRQQD